MQSAGRRGGENTRHVLCAVPVREGEDAGARRAAAAQPQVLRVLAGTAPQCTLICFDANRTNVGNPSVSNQRWSVQNGGHVSNGLGADLESNE